MKVLLAKLRGFFNEEDGPTAVEYAVMLALIIAVCATIVGSLGSRVNRTFDRIWDSIKHT